MARRNGVSGLAHTEPRARLRGLPYPEKPKHNLPQQLTSFVGRARELAELARLLPQTRVLTLTGAGGCGKSRLALQAASGALEVFPDGVWWVGLAPLSDPQLVAPAVAHVFQIRPLLGQTDLDAVVSYLASRRALVVVDNCEHLLDEAARVTEALVRGSASLTVLATTRQPLRIAGEMDWRVPSLSLPPRQAASDRDIEISSDAVQLFVDRATRVRPKFRITDENAEALSVICRELDGIPLAIELAAARLRAFSVEQIAEGLRDRFRLLTGGPRSSLPRHQTLRASVEWSHESLSQDERALFRRLGVFVGGVTLEAAQRVCAGDHIASEDVLDLLSSLVEKSLVQAEERGRAVRYRLLETLRQYALERLVEAEETEKTRQRLCDAYLELAERIQPGLETPRQQELLDVLDPEAANFAQAIEWAAETEPEKALRLCVALTFWWRLRSHFPQGEAGFRRALEATEGQSSLLRTRALVGRAYLLTWGGVIEAAVPAAYAALAEAERVGDESTLARAVLLTGTMTLLPDPVGSRPTLERARELAARSGDDYALMLATATLAYSYSHQNDHRRARPLFEEILPLAERTQSREIIAWYWLGVAWAELVTGGHKVCREAAERALAAAREIGDIVTEATASGTLATLDMYAGEPQRALERIADVRERALAHGGAFTLPLVDWGRAWAYAADGQLEEARTACEGLIGQGAGGMALVLAGAHVVLAEVLRLLADGDEAEKVANRGFELADRNGDRWLGAYAHLVLGRLAARQNDWAGAQRLHHEALSAMVEGGYYLELPGALEGLAEVAAGLESYQEAARILGAAARVRRERGLAAWPHQREAMKALGAHVLEALGAESFRQAVAEGEALSLDEAVAYVRRARGSRKRPSSGWESLTPTEIEVVRHAAAGLPNPEIARRMFISRGTVKGHLANIYAKLGIKNRSELAVRATRRAGSTQG